MKSQLLVTATVLSLMPALGQADDVTDALNAALDAYEDGDVSFALEELNFALQILQSMQQNTFQQFLPEAPAGWVREIDKDMNAGLAMMGGGTGASAQYRAENGSGSYSVTLVSDNPMVMSMGAMIANAGVMGMEVKRVGRQRVAIGENQALALVNNRVLVNIEGNDPDLLSDAMESIDFEGLSDFGS